MEISQYIPLFASESTSEWFHSLCLRDDSVLNANWSLKLIYELHIGNIAKRSTFASESTSFLYYFSRIIFTLAESGFEIDLESAVLWLS